MSYTVNEGAPQWKGKAIKGAGAGFVDLGSGLARDDGTVYMLGKPAKVIAASFEVLSETYARDAEYVYERLDTKLKPIKGADAATFTTLGDYHGRDQSAAYALGKKVKIRKGGAPEDFRPLGGPFGTDGRFLYHGSAATYESESAGVNWAAATLYLLEEPNWVNPTAVAVKDDHAVFWTDNYRGYHRLEGADAPALRRLTYGDYDSGYVSDGAKVWFGGAPVEGASGAAKALSKTLLRDGARYFIADGPALMEGPLVGGPNADRPGEIIAGPEGLFALDWKTHASSLVAAHIDAPEPTDEWLAAFWGKVLVAAEIATKRRPAAEHHDEGAASREDQIAAAPPCALAIEGEELLSEGQRAPASCWWQLAVNVLRAREGASLGDEVVISGTWLPNGDDGEKGVIKPLWPEFLTFLRALWEAGAHDEAHVLARVVHKANRHPRNLEAPVLAAMAGLPLPLFEGMHLFDTRHGITLTTNQGVAKLMLEPSWIAAEDARKRVDALRVFFGACHDVRNPKALREADAVLAERHAAEPLPYVRMRIRAARAILADRLEQPLPEGVALIVRAWKTGRCS